ncbi:hypothetical protein JRO89_XS01G0410100 [Xanthoceras sorbifolium]|uniref:Zinc finger LSD1-type domain-containing protein n=1 Tax=Xanthoceras sorbifolium TaxID=99658 RepID=A0ABQ8IQ63_9ROSI|nr:hypothetical protein JRO89_XS01G0410100 [Xanthoceras sorbifolium]
MPVPLAPYPTPPVPYTPPANGILQVPLVHRASLCVLDVETFCSIQLEQPPYAVLFAMQSQVHRNGPVGLWRLPHLTYVHPWSNKCTMFLLSHRKSSLGRMLLMYQYGARSVKCAVCNFVTSVGGYSWEPIAVEISLDGNLTPLFPHILESSLNKRYRTEVQWLKLPQSPASVLHITISPKRLQLS